MFLRDQDSTAAYEALQGYEPFVLTKSGRLMAALIFDGIDADALTDQDLAAIALLGRSTLELLPGAASVTHYYVHLDHHEVTLRDRGDTISGSLSRARARDLTERGLAKSYLVQVYTFADARAASRSFGRDVIANLPHALVSDRARKRIKARIANGGALILDGERLQQLASKAQATLKTIGSHWSKLANIRPMTASEFWQFQNYMASFDPGYFDLDIESPEEDIDLALVPGEIEEVQVGYTPYLKILAETSRFLRIGSMTGFTREPFGYLTEGTRPPLSLSGSYVLVSHFTMLDEPGRLMKFANARAKLERGRMSLIRMLKGDTVESPDERRIKFRREIEQLERAEAVYDQWGLAWNAVIIPGTDPLATTELSQEMNDALVGRGVQLVWETAGLPMMYRSIQPGGAARCLRNSVVTTTRAGLTTPAYKSSEGQPIVHDLGGEEATYIFETPSGEPFHYSGQVGGRNFTICVGPVRSGKTYFKNTVCANFLKYGGLARVVDIDPGSRFVAEIFEEEGGYVDIGAHGALNPFSTVSHLEDASGESGFRSHMSQLLGLMLAGNVNEAEQVLSADEQRDADQSIRAVMQMPPARRSLPVLLQHFGRDLRRKFSRWQEKGVYANIFDGETDSVSTGGTRVAVWNLQKYRDDDKALRPLLLELFYRTTREFEDPAQRHVAKLFEIDEAHHALAIPEFRDFITTKIRTWGKWGAGVSLWTQSPREFVMTEGWDAIRSAATTFIFMADGKLDEGLYREAFQLSSGQLNAIKSLQPRREAFIVQPELGIAKKVILQVDPLQHAINTSHPLEASIRERLVAEHGVHDGLRAAAIEIHEYRMKEDSYAAA